MVRNIDNLADEWTQDIQSVGDDYYDTFLFKRPKTEWAPYIDETAKDLSSGIQIGDLALSKDDFGRELGTYYRRGLKKTAGRYADLPSVLEEKVSDQKLGLLAYQLNELSYDITTTESGVDDVEKATEAVIEKLLARHAGDELTFSFDMSGGTVSDIATQLFKNETIASNVDVILNEFEESASQGLLSLMDEPQMMTPLWDHQRDALERWCEHDNRGYVDMATATGKTVLGLGALALQYGELHPDDQGVGGLVKEQKANGGDDILVVAHSDLILEQWRQEFDNHLNIPEERTMGSDDITLEWGTIHFRTPQSLLNEESVRYDLVLLDEAHHYAIGSEWGSLLNEFDGDVLAMSGSVNDAGSDSERIKERLSNSIGPEIKRYTITEARADGIIPSFDWEVHYAPHDVAGDDLEKVAKRSERAFRDFRKQVTRGELSIETDRRLRTYEDVRRFSHTTQGNSLKQQNEEFRDLVTRLFSRRTKQWNLSPVLDTVVDLIIEHSTTEKVVVLADSNAQVEELDSRLTDIVANPSSIYIVSGSQSRTEQRETIDKFDEPESAGILLGTGDLLGEGVDMQHASVAINMATGGVNPELVQRIGRVLRNPVDTPKHAMFYNVVGIPPTEAAAVPREDGKQILEQAAGFCSLGRRFDKLPGFATSEPVDTDAFGKILTEGAAFIDTLDGDGEYDWAGNTAKSDDLKALYSTVQSSGSDAETILGEWEEYAWEHSKEELASSTTEGELEISTDDTSSPESQEETHRYSSEKREREDESLENHTITSTEKQTDSQQSGSSDGYSNNEIQVPANSLAEYYDIFRNFASILEQVIEADQTAYRADQDQPMNRWQDKIENVVYRRGPEDASPSYGQQQGNRNPHKMTEYREAFGDGETITEYQCIPTAQLDGSDAEVLARKHILEPRDQIHLPVTPESGIPLPIEISSQEELEAAIDLLNEFPTEPEPAANDRPNTASVMEQEESEPTTKSAQNESDDPTTQPQREPEINSEESDAKEDTPTEQEIFWDRDVEPITKYRDEDTKAVDTGAASNGGSLDEKIDEWKSQLLDLTRRNSLISFKSPKAKSLPFEKTDPIAIAAELNDGEKIYLRKQPSEDETRENSTQNSVNSTELPANELLPTRVVDEAENSLTQIRLKNKQYLRERGVDSLYLSLGMLHWYSVDYSDEPDQSPLFLAPLELEEKTLQDGDRHDYVLKPKSEGLRLNPALRKKLTAERGINLPADTALSLEEIDAAFESVYETVRGFDRWTIQQDVVLGIFDFTKFSLYSDLERNRESIKNNSIIRALNGDAEALQKSEGDIETPSAEELDDIVDPVEMYQVLDADSSQQEAIEAAKRGKSFVLQGPPGTGKSQTIANIIAEKLADGERILFVSEKQAALDVVKNRLDDVGIGRFCLEVHGEKANKTDILGDLEDELKASQIKPAESRAQRLRKLRDRRETINQYGQHLFYSPDGWDLTAYQAFGIVSERTSVPRIDIGIDYPLDVGQETLREAVDELETVARFEDEIETYETSPWRHTTLQQWSVDTSDSMRQSLDQQVDAIDDLSETAEILKTELGVQPQSLAEYREMNQLLQHLSDRPDIPWQKAFFDGSFAQDEGRFKQLAELEQEREDLINDLSENYQRSFFSTDGSDLNSELAEYGLLKLLKPSYRSVNRKITNHAREEYDPGHEQLLEDTRKLAEIQRIEDRREDYRGVIQRLGPLYEGGDTDWELLAQAQAWIAKLNNFDSSHTSQIIDQLLSGTLPDDESLTDQTQTVLDQYDAAAAFFENAMAVEEMKVDGEALRCAPFSKLSKTLKDLRNEVPNLQQRVQFTSQLETVRETICKEYVKKFLTGNYSSDHLVPAFKKQFYTKWLSSVYKHTELGSFNADKMERYVEEFRRLDQEQQELAKIEIQHEVTKRRPSLSLEHASSSEQVLVRRETQKQRRHKPLRELFDEAGSFITQLTPCFMMSPLAVARYLRAGSIQFDTVVFDEASQIMPQDAVSSLIRADQAIIAGDTKQLPPTSFFQSDIETTEDVREDLDSILEETASVLPEKTLRWHYRSRSEELIQFSNYHYYNNSLRTFPENNPDVETGVSFEYVDDGVYDRGGSRQNEVEAQRVIDLIEEHAENHSEKSLGVVAFSNAQEQAIRDALAERREENAILDAFVSQDNVLDEFFIKNLEMVQGDERDRMVFSVGYGPDQNGTISTNFGPLNKSGGERRLNVAVTRAKEHITVLSSMLPGDIDLSGSNSIGAQHFKNYLEYAQKGKQALARNDRVTDTLDFDSQFEEAVYAALEDKGYDVVSQVQSHSYSIDLAIKHPDQPGKFVLGIECDGAAYHSSKTARDRDRTRQMVLENLGWTIHRIWSPDWTSNRKREVQKIEEKIESLMSRSDIESKSEEISSYKPKAIEFSSKTDHKEIAKYRNPSLKVDDYDRYDPDKQGMDSAVRNSLQDVVVQNGPIQTEAAFRTALEVWSQSRAGKKVQRTFQKGVDELRQRNRVYKQDEFLWPHQDNLNFVIRVNTDMASRPIDEIPIEEVAKAVALILKEGGQMTKDDLVLETTRLFGYQRRGKRIEDRIEDGLQLLKDIATIHENPEEKIALQEDVDVDIKIPQQVYMSSNDNSSNNSDMPSHSEPKSEILQERERNGDGSGPSTMSVSEAGTRQVGPGTHRSESSKVSASEVGGKCPKCGHNEFRFKHNGQTVTCVKCGNNHLMSGLDPI